MKKCLFFLFALLIFCGCKSICNETPSARNKVKYVFLFIADGFGENHRKLLKNEAGSPALDQFPIVRHTGTLNFEGKVTDSAASGTAIACGIKTYNGAIGVDPQRMPVKSISKEFKERHCKVGIISTSPINDATPSAHYANTFNRSERSLIVHDLYHSGFDFFGASHFYLDSRYKPTEEEYLALIGQKYQIFRDQNWDKINPTDKNFIISRMVRDFPAIPRKTPSLADFTAQAIKTLDNPNGFFLMVEEGFTDVYSHANDAGGLLRAAMDFDRAVAVALEFQKKHPAETLIIATADHNTGGLYFLDNYVPGKTALLYQQMQISDLHSKLLALYQQKADWDLFERTIVDTLSLGRLTPQERVELKNYFAYFVKQQRKGGKNKDSYDIPAALPDLPGKNHSASLAYGASRLRDKRNGLAWESTAHTGAKILTFAKGPGAEKFDRDDLENTSIAQLIREIVFQK
ncbi:MAG: alkaline phosphatase [Lentisphaerae bacterium]|nr:alkaline phosphatase [Lentisphaerota bacterium]